jgi:preprotein translocase subunit SecB
MAETQNQPEKQFSIQKIYTKDLSFETPNAPKIFREKWEPAVDFNLGTHGDKLDVNVYEVVLTVTITVKSVDLVAYLVEVKQAGIFTIENFSEPEMNAMLGSFCPNILFPYAREVVSDLVTKGGFPQLLLAPVNFDALYNQHLQELQQKTATPNTIN